MVLPRYDVYVLVKKIQFWGNVGLLATFLEILQSVDAIEMGLVMNLFHYEPSSPAFR